MQAHLSDRLRQGDRAAQYEVYNLYSKAMLNTALRIVQDLHEEEDVLQEVFLAVFTKIEHYTGDATLGAWIKRITVNKSINALHRRKASLLPLEEVLVADLVYHDEEDKMLPLWNVDQVLRAVESLSDGYRVVFSLYLLEGYDHREIAEILGITEGGSKSQYNRAKQKVREILTAQSYV